MNLLAKTRKINAMLQASAGKPVNFKEMAKDEARHGAGFQGLYNHFFKK